MKLRWISLLFASFLLVAPVVSADDGSVACALQSLIDQIVAILSGAAEPPDSLLQGTPTNLEQEGGLNYPPNG